jgi:hypothetical protein
MALLAAAIPNKTLGSGKPNIDTTPKTSHNNLTITSIYNAMSNPNNTLGLLHTLLATKHSFSVMPILPHTIPVTADSSNTVSNPSHMQELFKYP